MGIEEIVLFVIGAGVIICTGVWMAGRQMAGQEIYILPRQKCVQDEPVNGDDLARQFFGGRDE